jgi:phosphohistidine phosphatase SixA
MIKGLPMRTVALSIVLTLVSALHLAADTLHVAAIAEPGGDGLSWNTAFRSIDYALATWKPGDEIWVAQGNYPIVSAGYSIKNGMHVYGGFRGNETLREDRDWYRQRSVLSSNKGDFIFRLNDCDSTTRVDGFVLEGTQKVAVSITGGAPRVFNCHFRNTSSVVSGSAIWISRAGRVRIEYCTFENCRAGVNGGAIYVNTSLVSRRWDVDWGAFIGQCFFINCSAERGGGIYVNESKGQTQIVSSVFAGNRARDLGGAVGADGSWTYVNNCTFYKNGSTTGVMSIGGKTIGLNGGFVQNSVVWNGDEDTTRHIIHFRVPGDTSSFGANANLVERDFDYGFWQVDPSFENQDDWDGQDNIYGTDDDGLALSRFSMVRNAGVIDRFVNHRDYDIIGNPRLVGRKVDLGAYESQRTDRLGFREVVDELRKGKLILLYRHGKTDWLQQDPGPSKECFPGRNLIFEGREQCAEIGKVYRYLNIPIGDALSSTACRCWETLDKMVGRYTVKSHWAGGAGNSIQQRWNDLKAIPTNGNRVISSHDAVCQSIFNPDGDGTVVTTAEYMEGDCLILRPDGDTVEVLTQWCSENWTRYHVRFPDGLTSIPELPTGDANISAYPNPARESFRIVSTVASQVNIVDVYGRRYARIDLRAPSLQDEVNTAGWPTGTYFLLGHACVGRIVVTR